MPAAAFLCFARGVPRYLWRTSLLSFASILFRCFFFFFFLLFVSIFYLGFRRGGVFGGGGGGVGLGVLSFFFLFPFLFASILGVNMAFLYGRGHLRQTFDHFGARTRSSVIKKVCLAFVFAIQELQLYL